MLLKKRTSFKVITITKNVASLPHPPELFFFVFFYKIKHHHPTFSVAVRLSLGRILGQVMVSSRW